MYSPNRAFTCRPCASNPVAVSNALNCVWLKTWPPDPARLRDEITRRNDRYGLGLLAGLEL